VAMPVANCETNPTGCAMSPLTMGHWTGLPVFCKTNPTEFALGAEASYPKSRGLCAHFAFGLFGKDRELRVIIRASGGNAGRRAVPILPAQHVSP
jgi:hypothetical protein